jgi:hypothetical protein
MEKVIKLPYYGGNNTTKIIVTNTTKIQNKYD